MVASWESQPCGHHVDLYAAGQPVAGGRVAQGVVGAPPLGADELQGPGDGKGLLQAAVGRGAAEVGEQGAFLDHADVDMEGGGQVPVYRASRDLPPLPHVTRRQGRSPRRFTSRTCRWRASDTRRPARHSIWNSTLDWTSSTTDRRPSTSSALR